MNTAAPSSAKKLATAEYLLKIIKAIGITQSAFAKRIGVSQPNFTDMLKGRRSYPKHIVLRMEQEFGIPFEWCIGFKEFWAYVKKYAESRLEA